MGVILKTRFNPGRGRMAYFAPGYRLTQHNPE